jgi:hypothetical protein
MYHYKPNIRGYSNFYSYYLPVLSAGENGNYIHGRRCTAREIKLFLLKKLV